MRRLPSLSRKKTYIPPRTPTDADILYQQHVAEGLDPKDAAKLAQDKTGLSVVTGKPMTTRGYGWQTFK